MENKKRIISRLKGGMGNQMFEYAFAKALQLDYPEYDMVLDISEISGYESYREYALDCFNINESVTFIKDSTYDKYSRIKNPILRVKQKMSPLSVFEKYSKYNVFLWDEPSYKHIVIDENKDIFLNGYWQSSKYFAKYGDVIRQDYSFNNDLDDNCCFVLDRIKKSESVCVHIRLGDYLNNSIYSVCDEEYYINGIRLAAQEKSDACFFVFSDEIDKAKAMLHDLDLNISFVENKNSEKVELELMSNCKNFVISNSSFSWWAQYLSDANDKIVIAPSMWRNDVDVKDIYERNWTII